VSQIQDESAPLAVELTGQHLGVTLLQLSILEGLRYIRPEHVFFRQGGLQPQSVDILPLNIAVTISTIVPSWTLGWVQNDFGNGTGLARRSSGTPPLSY